MAQESETTDLEHWYVPHLEGNKDDEDAAPEVDHLVELHQLTVRDESNEILLKVLEFLPLILKLRCHLRHRLLLLLGQRGSNLLDHELLLAVGGIFFSGLFNCLQKWLTLKLADLLAQLN